MIRGLITKFIILAILFAAGITAVSGCGVLQTNVPEAYHFPEPENSEESFQEHLWGEHTMELMIQIGLMLAGAFGVAALLPAEAEE